MCKKVRIRATPCFGPMCVLCTVDALCLRVCIIPLVNTVRAYMTSVRLRKHSMTGLLRAYFEIECRVSRGNVFYDAELRLCNFSLGTYPFAQRVREYCISCCCPSKLAY
jgi:hypothetical protein